MPENTNNQVSVLDQPSTAERFAKIFSGVHGVGLERAAQMFEVERLAVTRELSEKAIDGVSEISKAGVFLDVITNGLSFSGQMKHVYMMSRNVKTGKKGPDGKDIYEKRLVYSTAPDGKIFLCQRAKSIERVTKPVIVYDCDTYSVTDTGGVKKITYVKKERQPNSKIVAGFVYLVFPDGSREPFDMDLDDIARLRGYSARNNRKWVNGRWETGDPNPLYSSHNGGIDPGFFGAKLINFALKNIRKAGVQSEYETEDIEYEPVVDPASPEFQPDAEPEIQPDNPATDPLDENPDSF